MEKTVRSRHPDAVCLGGACYIRLGGETLAKVELSSCGGSYNGLRLTILNRRTGPVDTITIHSWDALRAAKKECGEQTEWDVCRSALDIDALWQLAEEYLRLFRE